MEENKDTPDPLEAAIFMAKQKVRENKPVIQFVDDWFEEHHIPQAERDAWREFTLETFKDLTNYPTLRSFDFRSKDSGFITTAHKENGFLFIDSVRKISFKKESNVKDFFFVLGVNLGVCIVAFFIFSIADYLVCNYIISKWFGIGNILWTQTFFPSFIVGILSVVLFWRGGKR